MVLLYLKLKFDRVSLYMVDVYKRQDPEWIRQLQAAMPEMPEVRQARYAELGLPENDIALLVANKELADYYDQVMKHTQHAKIAANWVIVELPAGLTKLNTKLAENPVAPQAMAELVNMIVGGEISGKQAKIVFEEVLQGKDPKPVSYTHLESRL